MKQPLLLFLFCCAVKANTVPSGGLDLSGNLLPSVFPAGDPSEFALPVYLEEPSDSFAARGAPAVLKCRVAHAIAASFICNDEPFPSASDRDEIDAGTGAQAKEVTIAVKRADVMDVLGKFTCKCVAESKQGKVSSNEVTVGVAYLRKEFDTPPYSQQIELGGQAELRCHPPSGNPAPRVSHWLKNGEKINDPNFIQSGTGHLLILQARMEDTANYTCVASNGPIQRLSPAALVTVYVPGKWSEWSDWSDCNTKCGRGVMKRTRTCDNPAPINNGPGCDGPPVQKKGCNQICPSVDGQWSSWSSWSSCSPDCLQFRRRECANPPPKNGGHYCQGKDIASQECTGGMCKPGLNSIVLYGTEAPPSAPPSSSVATTDLTLCIGLVVAFLIFIVVVLIIIRLLKRKGSPHSGYSLTATGCHVHTADPNKPPSSSGYPSDLETPSSVCYADYPFSSDKNSNCSGSTSTRKGFKSSTPLHLTTTQFSEMRPLSEHFYEQPMVVFQPSKSPANSLEKTPFLTNGTTSSGQSSPSSSNWATVTEAGARITVGTPGMSAVTLTVPHGAVSKGFSHDVYVSILDHDKYRPQLDSSQTAVTAVVQCGPASVTGFLQKPVVLSVPHTSSSKRLFVLFCADLDSPTAQWDVLTTCADDVQIDSSMCHLVTDRFGSYVFVANVTDLNAIGGSTTSSSGCSSLLPSPDHEPASPYKLTASTKQALCRTLDVPSCQGNDWRQLAEVLGADHYVSFFATQPSPSEALLNLYEARNGGSNALPHLATLLRSINREDAVVVLDRDLKRLQ